MKRLMKAGIVVAAMAAVSMLGATAASAQRGASTVTINVLWTSEQQLPFDILVKNFERVYPNIVVNVSYTPLAQIGTVLQTEIQAGNPPDLFQSAGGNQNVGYGIFPLAAQGRLLDVSGGPWKKHIVPLVRQYFERKHKLYGLPLVYTPYVMFTNPDLFTKIGATVPKTFGDLLNLTL